MKVFNVLLLLIIAINSVYCVRLPRRFVALNSNIQSWTDMRCSTIVANSSFVTENKTLNESRTDSDLSVKISKHDFLFVGAFLTWVLWYYLHSFLRNFILNDIEKVFGYTISYKLSQSLIFSTMMIILDTQILTDLFLFVGKFIREFKDFTENGLRKD